MRDDIEYHDFLAIFGYLDAMGCIYNLYFVQYSV